MDVARKKKKYIDPETGKEYNLNEFDDTHSWSKAKRKKTMKEYPLQTMPNILGRV